LNFRFADFEINVARRELRRAGAIVHTEPQVFDLLVHLIRNRDRIVRKDELIDAIWQGRIVSEATLSSRISAARRALGDSGSDQSLIRTLHRRGFRFVSDVEDESPAPAAVAIEKGPPTVAASIFRPLFFRPSSPCVGSRNAIQADSALRPRGLVERSRRPLASFTASSLARNA
jgi:DNA-binding winged helix-turn-helix (wHTH) protein